MYTPNKTKIIISKNEYMERLVFFLVFFLNIKTIIDEALAWSHPSQRCLEDTSLQHGNGKQMDPF